MTNPGSTKNIRYKVSVFDVRNSLSSEYKGCKRVCDDRMTHLISDHNEPQELSLLYTDNSRILTDSA